MEFEKGKQYSVKLGRKHMNSIIKANYVEQHEETGLHVVEMISPINWKGARHTVAFNEEMKQKYGHGINFMVEAKQILEEVK